MHWTDEGIIIGTRRHGESSLIVELMTRQHGRHLGLVRGGRSRRQQPVLQLGNTVAASWRARLDEHLGNFAVEPTKLRAAELMERAAGLYGIQLMGALLRLLPERDPHLPLFTALEAILDSVPDDLLAAELLVRFELAVLTELGFGLDLSRCAATGIAEDLAFVSPRSARAVSRIAGEPYAAKLLRLPAFLVEHRAKSQPQNADITDAFALTGYFLTRHVYQARGIAEPPARSALLAHLERMSA